MHAQVLDAQSAETTRRMRLAVTGTASSGEPTWSGLSDGEVVHLGRRRRNRKSIIAKTSDVGGHRCAHALERLRPGSPRRNASGQVGRIDAIPCLALLND